MQLTVHDQVEKEKESMGGNGTVKKEESCRKVWVEAAADRETSVQQNGNEMREPGR